MINLKYLRFVSILIYSPFTTDTGSPKTRVLTANIFTVQMDSQNTFGKLLIMDDNILFYQNVYLGLWLHSR